MLLGNVTLSLQSCQSVILKKVIFVFAQALFE
jgi:hypothetical protein